MAKKAEKALSFEKALERLDEITSLIESEKTGLNDALELYKEGLELSVFCDENLKTVENKVSVLQKNALGAFAKSEFES